MEQDIIGFKNLIDKEIESIKELPVSQKSVNRLVAALILYKNLYYDTLMGKFSVEGLDHAIRYLIIHGNYPEQWKNLRSEYSTYVGGIDGDEVAPAIAITAAGITVPGKLTHGQRFVNFSKKAYAFLSDPRTQEAIKTGISTVVESVKTIKSLKGGEIEKYEQYLGQIQDDLKPEKKKFYDSLATHVTRYKVLSDNISIFADNEAKIKTDFNPMYKEIISVSTYISDKVLHQSSKKQELNFGKQEEIDKQLRQLKLDVKLAKAEVVLEFLKNMGYDKSQDLLKYLNDNDFDTIV